MIVYVARDGDATILGVYGSLEAAMAAHVGRWQQGRPDHWFNDRDEYSPQFRTITAFPLSNERP